MNKRKGVSKKVNSGKVIGEPDYYFENGNLVFTTAYH